MKKSKLVYTLISSLLIMVVAGSFLAGAHYNNGLKTNSAYAAASDSFAPDGKNYRDTPIVRAAKLVSPAVVGIINKAYVQDFWSGQKALVDRTSGSGVAIMKKDGNVYIVTNNHVVKGAQSLKVLLADGKTADGVLVGTDSFTDIAVIKIKDPGMAIAKMGNSDDLMVGEPAIAIGSPLGMDFRNSVTAGVISAVDRKLDMGDTTASFIQTDAAINPGNSGGALFDAQGRIIGVNGRASFEKRGRVNVGVGYAISANQLRHFLGCLKGGRLVDHATLGATAATAEDGRVVVSDILDSSDAYRRGLRYDDEIVAIAGRTVRTVNALKNVLGTLPAGWRVPLVYRRQGRRYEILVRLAGVHSAPPERPSQRRRNRSRRAIPPPTCSPRP